MTNQIACFTVVINYIKMYASPFSLLLPQKECMPARLALTSSHTTNLHDGVVLPQNFLFLQFLLMLTKRYINRENILYFLKSILKISFNRKAAGKLARWHGHIIMLQLLLSYLRIKKWQIVQNLHIYIVSIENYLH